MSRRNQFDPFGSRKNMQKQYNNFQQNPMQYLMQNKLNIPPEYANDPDGAIQYLMSSGQLTQQQYDYARQFAGKAFGMSR